MIDNWVGKNQPLRLALPFAYGNEFFETRIPTIICRAFVDLFSYLIEIHFRINFSSALSRTSEACLFNLETRWEIPISFRHHFIQIDSVLGNHFGWSRSAEFWMKPFDPYISECMEMTMAENRSQKFGILPRIFVRESDWFIMNSTENDIWLFPIKSGRSGWTWTNNLLW